MSPRIEKNFMLSRRGLLAALAGLVVTRPEPARADDDRPLFTYYWGVGCPHCARAKPFVAKLRKQHRDLRFEAYEVRKDKDGRRRFAKEVKRLGIRDPGVPLFVCGDEHVMGWVSGETQPAVREMIARCKRPEQ